MRDYCHRAFHTIWDYNHPCEINEKVEHRNSKKYVIPITNPSILDSVITTEREKNIPIPIQSIEHNNWNLKGKFQNIFKRPFI